MSIPSRASLPRKRKGGLAPIDRIGCGRARRKAPGGVLRPFHQCSHLCPAPGRFHQIDAQPVARRLDRKARYSIHPLIENAHTISAGRGTDKHQVSYSASAELNLDRARHAFGLNVLWLPAMWAVWCFPNATRHFPARSRAWDFCGRLFGDFRYSAPNGRYLSERRRNCRASADRCGGRTRACVDIVPAGTCACGFLAWRSDGMLGCGSNSERAV